MVSTKQPRRRNRLSGNLSAISTAKPAKARKEVADINAQFAQQTADAARGGETDAAREILDAFCWAVESSGEHAWSRVGAPIQWAHARYLADAFKAILDDQSKDVAIALGIKTSNAGRRRGATTVNAEALAAGYWHLVRQGIPAEAANKELQKRLGFDRRTIQRAAKNDGNFAYRDPQKVDEENLKVTFKPYAAVIAAILAVYPAQSKK